MAPGNSTFSFTTFLSHRYKSPEINIFFFKLFADIAEIQFNVDEGTFATNVTRLERMIRAADAFIGIYPFPGTSEAAQQPEELKKASRYFRLELDLAIRSQKPAIVFYDERYGNILRCPDNILSVPFNFLEITGSGQVPKAKLYKEIFKKFREMVSASMTYSMKQPNSLKTVVGIALPFQSANVNGYTPEDIQIIEAALEKNGFDERRILRWPPSLNRDAFALFHQADWVIVDTGEEMAKTGIPAYLHGQFVPMMRLRRVLSDSEATAPSAMERALFADVEVGYNKDIIVWNTHDTLEAGLQERLFSLKANVRRISILNEAEKYFGSAALRKEAVFLSYSGKDRDIAAGISAELKKYFQTVFDYRDGESIRPGQPWINEIFKQLSTSAIGIPLLSEDYFASRNCAHEAQEMMANYDNGKMKVMPVKLYKDPLASPPWMQNLQYLRFTDYAKTEDAVKEIIQLVTVKQ
jgi:hypothetical protein